MSEAVELRESEELVLPNGVLVDTSDAPACAHALQELRALEARIREAKQLLTDAVVQESKRLGKKTIPLAGGFVAEVKSGNRLLWDAQRLEDGLRKLGCPEDRISEIVRQEVTLTVSAVEARRAGVANPAYADLIAICRTETEDRPTIQIRKR